MIVVSLTTIPPRLVALEKTISSLQNQTRKPDRIILNFPKEYHRFPGVPVPDLTIPGVEINRCQDFGPATKLLGVLLLNLAPETTIIVVDDDRIYDPGFIQRMMEESDLHPDYAITEACWSIGEVTAGGITHDNQREPKGLLFSKAGYVDTLAGCCGFVVKRSFFTDVNIFLIAAEAFLVDDIWISGFLTIVKVPIWCHGRGWDALRTENDPLGGLCYLGTRVVDNTKAVQYFQNTYGIWK
jgi:hypothetical protein